MGQNIVWYWQQEAAELSSDDVHAPAANTAAAVTYSGAAGTQHRIAGIAWSYSDTPTGGNLKVEDGSGTTVFEIDVTDKGHGFVPLLAKGSDDTDLIVTLAAGGAGISGKVSVLGHWTET